MENMKKYLAEILGIFVFVFIGTGSAVDAGESIKPLHHVVKDTREPFHADDDLLFSGIGKI